MTETIARGALLRRAAIGGAAAIAGGAAMTAPPRRAGSAPSAAQDDRIMALALRLERSQRAMYEAADAFARTAIRLENITIQADTGQVANLTPAPRAEWALAPARSRRRSRTGPPAGSSASTAPTVRTCCRAGSRRAASACATRTSCGSSASCPSGPR